MNLGINPDPERAQQIQDQQIQSFSLVGRGGWPVLVLWLLAFLLGVFNFSLFSHAIPGVKGVLAGLVAVAVEGTALYCVLNFPRSIDKHKEILGTWGKRLFSFSLVHGTLSFIHSAAAVIDNEIFKSFDFYILFYSHLIAFPAMLILLSISVSKIIMHHWSGETLKQLAASRLIALKSRSEALIEQSQMRDQNEMARLRAEIFAEQAQIQADLMPIVRRFVSLREQRDRLVKEIDDPLLREQIVRDVGKLFSDPKQRPARKKPVGEIPATLNETEQEATGYLMNGSTHP